jgi:hypothetical protein
MPAPRFQPGDTVYTPTLRIQPPGSRDTQAIGVVFHATKVEEVITGAGSVYGEAIPLLGWLVAAYPSFDVMYLVSGYIDTSAVVRTAVGRHGVYEYMLLSEQEHSIYLRRKEAMKMVIEGGIAVVEAVEEAVAQQTTTTGQEDH